MMTNNNTVSVSQLEIPVFNGENYEFWSIKMKTLFKSQELWGLVENGYPDDDWEAKSRENQKRDNKVLFFIQQSLTPKFDHVVAAIEESKDLTTYSFDELQGSLQSHEARLNRTNEKSGEKAFQVMGEPHKQQDNSRKATYRGGYCGRGDYRGRGGRGRGREGDEEIKLFMAYQDDVIASKDIWFLDSGCSNHMARIKSLFKELDESYKVKVRLGDDKQMQVEGKGTMAISNGHGNIKLLYNVYFIPTLSQNLLSIGQLMGSGYSVMFDDMSCVIKDKKSGKIIVDVQMAPNKLFPLEVSNVESQALVVKENSESKLWHLRYGHLNETLEGRLSDDCSRMSLVYFFYSKSKAFETFKKFKALVEKKSGRSINALCAARGGEFLSNEFNQFCEEQGIHRELITPYTPQQNGVAERKNRTIVEMARSLLRSKRLPDKFWAESVAVAVYLLNLSPTRVVLN
ncbi:Retrovirus-related Pol polyprotein from transposon TNT 1-94 [Gossypium australe]|uniref:Retrovirus-related Pol polyprotein from transposon TNT 1-94 n=1 Tax=Gossypium australe TaxID=47621 RepID=A0A5B6VDT1_9ROSI|nr:Retrovirus-related Pol polyprotein from transposon TNT 1-94 [Gossypium australe]